MLLGTHLTSFVSLPHHSNQHSTLHLHFYLLHLSHLPHTLTFIPFTFHTPHLTHVIHSPSYSLTLHLTPSHSLPHIPSHFSHFSHTLTLPYSTPSLEPPSQTTVMTAIFSLASQRKSPHSAVASSSLLTSSLCPPGHWGGDALYSTKTIPSLEQRVESCSSHTGEVGQ